LLERPPKGSEEHPLMDATTSRRPRVTRIG
jgi:hypothetical protein